MPLLLPGEGTEFQCSPRRIEAEQRGAALIVSH